MWMNQETHDLLDHLREQSSTWSNKNQRTVFTSLSPSFLLYKITTILIAFNEREDGRLRDVKLLSQGHNPPDDRARI